MSDVLNNYSNLALGFNVYHLYNYSNDITYFERNKETRLINSDL